MTMMTDWHPTHPHIMLWRAGKSFTLAEYHNARHRGPGLMYAGNTPNYYIVLDLSHTQDLPGGLVKALCDDARRDDAYYLGTVVVGAPLPVRVALSSLGRLGIGARRYDFARTCNEAEYIINRNLLMLL